MTFDKWKHLLVDGEFMEREKILSGLTLEQAARKPSEHSHSIYEELWHASRWQNIVVLRDEGLYEDWPVEPPATEEEWRALVAEFLAGLEKALEWARSPEKLAHEVEPGVTMAELATTDDVLAWFNAEHSALLAAVHSAAAGDAGVPAWQLAWVLAT